MRTTPPGLWTLRQLVPTSLSSLNWPDGAPSVGPAAAIAYRPLKEPNVGDQVHRFSDLFAQLGLPSDDAGIHQWLSRHAPLAENVRLSEAPFWSAAQAAFVREQIAADADWAELVDQLNVALRAST